VRVGDPSRKPGVLHVQADVPLGVIVSEGPKGSPIHRAAINRELWKRIFATE
jgi:hypothetical protein